MKPNSLLPYQTASSLREAFDRSFAEAPVTEAATKDDFLAVRVGSDPYAFRLLEIESLHRDRKVVPVASPIPEFLGIAAFRGVLVPVYDLGRLLGYASGSPCRWLVLARSHATVGLAFQSLEGHLRAARDSVSFPDRDGSSGYVRGAVHLGGVVRPLVHVASMVEAIAGRVRPNNPLKEQ